MSRLDLMNKKICRTCLCVEFDDSVTRCSKCSNNSFLEIEELQQKGSEIVLRGKLVRFERVVE